MSQELVGWLLAIYAGAIVGWVMEQLTISRHGSLINIVVGVTGAVIANLGYTILGPASTMAGINLVIGIIGALCLIMIIPNRKRRKKSSPKVLAHWDEGSSASGKMYALKK
jgi:uncharacterized membrane protein YeaQ/YmgE (transglycosylase-associated protein family)